MQKSDEQYCTNTQKKGTYLIRLFQPEGEKICGVAKTCHEKKKKKKSPLQKYLGQHFTVLVLLCSLGRRMPKEAIKVFVTLKAGRVEERAFGVYCLRF